MLAGLRLSILVRIVVEVALAAEAVSATCAHHPSGFIWLWLHGSSGNLGVESVDVFFG